MVTVTLTKEQIDKIFDEATHQADYVLGLYKSVVKEWDQIQDMNQFPYCHPKLNEYLFDKAIKFDRQHHPNVISGGAWMNNGFGGAEIKNDLTLGEWDVKYDPAKLIFKNKQPKEGTNE